MNMTDNETTVGVEYCNQVMHEAQQKAAGMVVYGSQLEKVLTLVVIVTTSIFTMVGQFSVIITIVLSESLRQMPHFIVILTCCIADLFMVVTTTPMYVWQYSYGCIPKLLCRIFSEVGLSSGFGIGNWIGFMALERAVYFCYPMRYERLFSPRNMAVGACTIFGISGIYILITGLVIGRGYHATILGCNLPSSGFQTSLQILLFIFPAAVITIVCVVKIWKLTKSCSVAPARLAVVPSTSATVLTRPKHTTSVASVHPAADDNHAPSVMMTAPKCSDDQPATTSRHDGDPRVPSAGTSLPASECPQAFAATISSTGPATGHPPPGIPSQQAKKAFRMIVLVSGAFWGTILPSYVIRACLFMSGHTWAGLDTRDYATQAIIMRIGNYGYSSVSSLLNPIIYFYSRRDLRREFWRLLGIRPNAVNP